MDVGPGKHGPQASATRPVHSENVLPGGVESRTPPDGAAWAGVAAAPVGGQALDIDEIRRLDALDSFEIIDTAPEPGFDRIVNLAVRIFGTEVALVCLIDENRVWYKAKAGTESNEQLRAGSFCSEAIRSPDILVVEDAQAEPWLGGAGPLGAACGFYAGAPLIAARGEHVGTVCIMDRCSRPFSDNDKAALSDLAAIVSEELEHRRRTIAFARLNQRSARTDAMMHAVADAATCEQALAGLLTRLCDDHGAAAGHIWRLTLPDQVLREVSRNPGNRIQMDAHFELARRLGAKPGNSLTADAIVSGKPRAVRFAGVADLHRYPMLASIMRHGLMCQVIQPLRVAGEQFAITLFFDTDRTDLDLVLEDVGALADTIRPALYRKVAEERMHLLSTALDRANDSVMITEAPPHDPSGPRIAYVNSSFCRATGYAAHEVVGQSPRLLLGPDADLLAQGQFARAMREGTPTRTEVEHCRKDGTRFWVEMDVTPLADATGWQTLWISIQRDITLRRQTDQAGREREASNRTLFEQSPMPTLVFDRHSLHFLDVNGAAVSQYGWSRAQFLAMSLPDLLAADEQPTFGTLIAGDQVTDIARRSWTHLRADGSRMEVTVASHALTYAGEDAVMAVLQDVTEVEAARRAMQEANLRLEDLARQLQARTAQLTEVHRLARLGAWRRSLDGSDVMWSDEMFEVTGFPQSAGIPSMKETLARIHPDDHAALRLVQNNAATMRAARMVDFRIVLPGGGVRHCRLDARPMLDDAGTVTGLYGYCQDITTHKQTEMALLRSEKLKSIGQLTGGIAHDFNNLLTVVTLNLEEALDTIPEDGPLRDVLQPAMHAAVRGAELTKQLLSYARRAALRPERVRLSGFFENLRPLLTRTIGKRYDLRLEVHDDGTAFIDPAQLENAIINLVINARDAMPDGGCIRVSTSLATVAAADVLPGRAGHDVPDDLAPGRYLRISVADTGTGIPPELLAQVFEPFFTTKDVGRGSGLGLSMVYGFAKQSGGQAMISSELGAGTTVRLFLPVVSPKGEVAPPLSVPAWQNRGLRALVVDDEPAVLATAARMASNMGLEVTTALTAADAATWLRDSEGFDLLFSDVRLPGPVDGVALAAQARAQLPGISVLLTSGYTDHWAAALDGTGGSLPGDTRFLAKPYTRQALHAALTVLLGRE